MYLLRILRLLLNETVGPAGTGMLFRESPQLHKAVLTRAKVFQSMDNEGFDPSTSRMLSVRSTN